MLPIRRLFTAIVAALTASSSGCNRDSVQPENAPIPKTTQLPEIIRTTTIACFDDDGDPEVREMSDGSLEVVFNFMPPTWVPEDQYTRLSAHLDLIIGEFPAACQASGGGAWRGRRWGWSQWP
jgi:hypothetical protein